MKKIINVYCITYGPHRLDSEKMVINRLAEVVDKVDAEKFDIQVHICDNNSPLEFKKWLLDTYDKKFKLFLSNENIGKARIVNHVHKSARKCDYVCSMDSDMMIKNEDFFDHMTYGLDNFDGKIGLVCAEQDKGSIHKRSMLTTKLENAGHTYMCSPIGGTAGSCLMIKNDTWKAVGGYAEFDNIFGGNDGWVVAQVTKRLKKLTALSVEGVCDHIGEHTQQYHSWKVHQATTLKASGQFKSNSGFYD
jgi:glycosyltransferase involved in cell wall biosynthesis